MVKSSKCLTSIFFLSFPEMTCSGSNEKASPVILVYETADAGYLAVRPRGLRVSVAYYVPRKPLQSL